MEQEGVPKSKNEEAKNLGKMGDAGAEKIIDSGKAAQSLAALGGGGQKKTQKKKANLVAIKMADVRVVMAEMEVDQKQAEKALRANEGDLVASLAFLVNQ
eukprot:CAMPEP_0174250224 /NCGR_PEP_ID=MMETSP0439-20130205/464_1 /TAXON_ID=0 /ORGANISM="Stereomyxa ramosa, Strain Chinc5" /LENGTH=99 /DNA_ID=CAMNT_0015330235 /DNA_START=51 /DNA_END=350 /DNA_ORIENTATION=-